MSLDNAAMTVFGDSISGNCLKVKFVADRLGIPYDWVEVSVLKGETRTAEFLAINPAGQVPAVRFADNGVLAQSNAIMLHLAEHSDLVPRPHFERAQMFQWLFWEQDSRTSVGCSYSSVLEPLHAGCWRPRLFIFHWCTD